VSAGAETGRPPGRPRSAEADAAIIRATLEALREEGFRGLSVEDVRQRAGVGKATIYRRFPSKEALVRAAIESLNPDLPEPPDTGSLRGDLAAVFRLTYDAAVDRRSATFAPRLLAESADDAEFHELFREALVEPRRAGLRVILGRARGRGELREGFDEELVIDMLAGPVVYRVLLDGGTLNGVADRMDALLEGVLYGVTPR
jgi:AcrR family transcriptional regulator